MILSKDYALREEILAPYYTSVGFGGGINNFANMPVEVLKKLVELNFADPEETQNASPSISEFISFMEEVSKYRAVTITAHGYSVSKDRDDYRVSVEGLEISTTCQSALNYFANWGHQADEFVLQENYGRIWWD